MADRRTNDKVFTASKVAEFMTEHRGKMIPVSALDPFFRDFIKLHQVAASVLKASKSGMNHELDNSLKELDEII